MKIPIMRSPSPLLLRARKSGRCPPLLLAERYSLHGKLNDDGFDEAVMRIVNLNSGGSNNGLCFNNDAMAGLEFEQILRVSRQYM